MDAIVALLYNRQIFEVTICAISPQHDHSDIAPGDLSIGVNQYTVSVHRMTDKLRCEASLCYQWYEECHCLLYVNMLGFLHRHSCGFSSAGLDLTCRVFRKDSLDPSGKLFCQVTDSRHKNTIC